MGWKTRKSDGRKFNSNPQYPRKYQPHVSASDVKRIQSHRSKKARDTDAALKAKVVSSEEWAKDPSRTDLQGVDTPNHISKDKSNNSGESRNMDNFRTEIQNVKDYRQLGKYELQVKSEDDDEQRQADREMNSHYHAEIFDADKKWDTPFAPLDAKRKEAYKEAGDTRRAKLAIIRARDIELRGY